MTAKEYLQQIDELNTTIKNIDDQIQALRAEEVALKSVWPDGQPHGSETTDPVGNQASKLADELREAERSQLQWRRALWRKRMEIIETLSMLKKPEHNRLLYLRYVEGQTWEQIAVDMGYTYRHITRTHGYALQELTRILNEL